MFLCAEQNNFEKVIKTVTQIILVTYKILKHMKRSNKQNSLLLILGILLFIFPTKQSFSQSDPLNKVIIELQKGNKIKQIKSGKIVRIWYAGEKFKGRLDSITPNTIFVNDKEFDINKIEKIGIKFKGTIITGSIVGTAGLLFTSLGTMLIIKGYSSGGLGGAIGVAIGVIIDLFAVPTLALGTSIVLIGKKYKIKKGWTLKSVQVN